MDPLPPYRVTAYNCGEPKELDEINRLATLANSQQTGKNPPFDPRVLPWVHGCEKSHESVIHVRHYVAQKPDGTIVGWLLAETRNRFGRIYVYLSEISATRIPSPEHRGIGKALYDKLLEDAKADGAYFIYLYPLTDAAKATYTKWGYDTPYDGVKQQFVELRPATNKKRVVPARLVARLMDPLPATYFVEARNLASDLGQPEFAKQIGNVSRDRKDDESFVAKLKEALETISIFTEMPEPDEEPMSVEDQLATLHEVFDEAIREPAAKRQKTAGRRKTHRHRRHRKTRRRHK